MTYIANNSYLKSSPPLTIITLILCDSKSLNFDFYFILSNLSFQSSPHGFKFYKILFEDDNLIYLFESAGDISLFEEF